MCDMFKGCNPARDEETGVQGGWLSVALNRAEGGALGAARGVETAPALQRMYG